MKKYYSFLSALILSFISPFLFAQTPTWEWADAAGDHGNEAASSVAIDAAGNAYITGSYTSAFIDFGTYSLLNTFNGTADIHVVKYNPAGVVLWANTFGGADGDAATGITVDAFGNVLITGWFASPSISFGSTVLTNSGTASSDLFIVKFDPSGNVIWAKSAGSTGNDRGQHISTDANGNVFVVGWYTSPTINFGTGALTNSGSSTNEIFAVKYDPNGNALWSKSVGGTNYDAAYGCATDQTGNLYMTGSFASASIDFGSGALVNTQTGFHDFFINKYDASGNSLWSKSATGDYDDIAYAVAISGSNIYVTGYFSSPTVSFGTNPVLTNASAPTPDIFIAQYSSTGTANWSARAGGIDEDAARCVYADASGNAYITGSFTSTSINFGSGTLSNVSPGTKDIFVAAFNNSGTSLWSLPVGNTSDEVGYGITCNSNASIIYVAGMFNSGSLSFGATTVYKGCGDDLFLAKLGNTSTGFAESSDANDFLIYPNPSNGIFSVPEKLKNAEVEIYNAMGEEIYFGAAIQGSIDISANGSGVYFARITAEGKYYSQRLLVE
ncbi:hypothetical protein BH09BAC5_BH09BAC5_22630 [soil metagenome]